MERFVRLKQLLGGKALKKLNKARIVVFGLGAVGSFALESLARSGVGEFALVDFDEIRHSNFNRQLLALESTVGKLKVELAKKRVLDINPLCNVIGYPSFAAMENLPVLLSSSSDIVIDAIDSLKPKSELISYCISKGIKIISSMGSGGKTDPFSIRIGDISEATRCSLAVRLRKLLKKKGISKGVRCVYSTQKALNIPLDVCYEQEIFKRGRLRKPVGTIAYMSGIFGLMISYEVIRSCLDQNIN